MLDDTKILQSKLKLDNQYWVNQGHLIIRNCYNYSNKKNVDQEKVKSFLLESLERYTLCNSDCVSRECDSLLKIYLNVPRYGFFTNHCYEVLLHTNNDLEKSMQILLEKYFNLKCKVEGHITSKNLTEMDDELIALKSIYENILEEKVPHKHWVFHLELPYLAEWYFQNNFKSNVSAISRRNEKSKPLCRNFNLTGTCRFGDRCKFLHEKSSSEKKSTLQDVEMKLKSSFDLEIRFQDGESLRRGLINFENIFKSTALILYVFRLQVS